MMNQKVIDAGILFTITLAVQFLTSWGFSELLIGLMIVVITSLIYLKSHPDIQFKCSISLPAVTCMGIASVVLMPV